MTELDFPLNPALLVPEIRSGFLDDNDDDWGDQDDFEEAEGWNTTDDPWDLEGDDDDDEDDLEEDDLDEDLDDDDFEELDYEDDDDDDEDEWD